MTFYRHSNEFIVHLQLSDVILVILSFHFFPVCDIVELPSRVVVACSLQKLQDLYHSSPSEGRR